MKLSIKYLLFCLLCLNLVMVFGQESIQDNDVMSKAYWDYWNPDVQARIDHDIDLYRKADAVLQIKGLPAGTEVNVEQVSHEFVFGANSFNFNQLGSNELNNKYKELFGSLFNSATIPFYWKKFEMQPNRPRFREEYWDTEAYWNGVENPNAEPHWRRPAPDPIVAFCESKGIRRHGHPIVWGITSWHYPEWIYKEFCPADEKEKIESLGKAWPDSLTPAQIAEIAPVYCSEINRLFRKRLTELAEYYGDRINSWDVVNESAVDYENGRLIPGNEICASEYHILMPGDYVYQNYRLADQRFPKNVDFFINDYMNTDSYTDEVKELLDKGCRVDAIGSQMHLFDPQQCLDIAAGKPIKTPEQVWKDMATISKAGLPIHLSEITITSPGDDERGREIQAVIARNLYRLWFSIEQMMGITWWNIVDGCGAPGEPTISGLFTRNMEPKPSFYALDKLINDEWQTRVVLKTDPDGNIRFRGFYGKYKIIVKYQGKEIEREVDLKKSGKKQFTIQL